MATRLDNSHTRELQEEFREQLDCYSYLLHRAVIEDHREFSTDRRLYEAWVKAEAAKKELLMWTTAVLERLEALEAELQRPA